MEMSSTSNEVDRLPFKRKKGKEESRLSGLDFSSQIGIFELQLAHS